MKKEIRRTVDDRLPKWLHSRFLSAVNYIWQVKVITKKALKELMMFGKVDNSQTRRCLG